MVKGSLVCSFCIFAFSCAAMAGTVAYWQMDNSVDNLDAVADDGFFYDLTEIGNVKSAASDPCINPVPNPSMASWSVAAGDGDPCTNSYSQGFSGDTSNPDGWWRDPNAGVGDFTYTYEYGINGGPVTAHTAYVDSAFMFDNNKSFTAECFVKPNQTGYLIGNRGAMSYPDPYRGWQLWITAGGTILRLYMEGDSGFRPEGGPYNELELTASLTVGRWYHVAAVWDHDDGVTGMARLYIDGVEVASAPGDANWSGITGGPLTIGVRKIWFFDGFPEYGFIWDYGMHGGIDEMRFVDEALTPEYFLNGTVPYVSCGEGVTVVGDLNSDCKVNLADIGIFVQEWLSCTEPGGQGCVQN